MSLFEVGQTVYLKSDERARTRETFEIARVLPNDDGDQYYQIKSSHGPGERVVLECNIEPVSPEKNPRGRPFQFRRHWR
jgi:hypothetical protein